MIKILLISTNADEAGAPRHVETIVNALHSVFNFILIFGERGPVSERLIKQGHNVYIVNEMRTAINPFKDFIALIKITLILLIHKPNLVHCHSAKAGMLGRISAFFCRRKWLYTVHGWSWRGASKISEKLIIFIEFILSKIPGGFFIYVADDVSREAQKKLKINCKKGVVIHNGVASVKADQTLTYNPLVVMMPARVCSAKDHRSLIIAFELLNDPNLRLLLCGKGTDDPKFIEFTNSLAPKTFKSITFLGQRSDMQKIYAEAHIVVLISNFEALPLSIIEAMSCSKGIIATKVGGVPELIQHGINGILVEPNCIEDIVEALKVMSNNSNRSNMGINARNTYVKNFTDNSMLDSLSVIYHSLVLTPK